MSLGVVLKMLHGEVDNQGVERCEREVRADLRDVDVPFSLKPQSLVLIGGLHNHLVQSRLHSVHVWYDTEGGGRVAVGQNDAFGARAWQALDAEVVVNGNSEVMPWKPLLHQDVCTVFQEVKSHALEGDVVGIAVHLTATVTCPGFTASPIGHDLDWCSSGAAGNSSLYWAGCGFHLNHTVIADLIGAFLCPFLTMHPASVSVPLYTILKHSRGCGLWPRNGC